MEFYLIRHGQADMSRAMDPYTPPLSSEGRAQAERLAEACVRWGIQFLCASTMRRAQETADAITARLPDILRWDLEELEDVTLDDLHYEPTAGQWASTWTEDQLDRAFRQVWARVMSALARIEVYAEANGIERIAIVAHGSTIALLLLNWLGLDWRARSRLEFAVAPGMTCRVTIEGERVRIDWINTL
ncbi:MAG: histidine phosphatase family protein [Chloroflexi bacterium]|nr:histidine phosphatase family protein [Chloroflexota bacterium]